MPTYNYQCKKCMKVEEVFHSMKESLPGTCCDEVREQVILKPPMFSVPPHMQASPDKLKYYGVKNIITGEGITEHTDVRDKPGIRVKPIKE